MHEEIESVPPKRNRRLRPDVLLFLCIIVVSGLLISKIQNRKPHPEARSLQQSPGTQNQFGAGPVAQQTAARSDRLEEQPTTTGDSASPESELVLTQTVRRQPLLPDVETVKQGELASTSWQNPFYSLFWKNRGWQFTEEGMESVADQLCIATFIRPYKKISVSFRVDVVQSFPDFEMQLLTRDPAKPDQVLVASQIHFQNTGVSVAALAKQTSKMLKQVQLNPAQDQSTSIPIRLVGTGNRFVISINKQRVLTCAQPAAQSGKECFLCFLADKQPVRITALRLEGE